MSIQENKPGLDFGWKTHSAITDWTGKVDSKASAVLSLGGAVLGFIIVLSAQDRILTQLEGWRYVIRNIGIALFILGVFSAALVVMPRLGRIKARKNWQDNFIYFGHLRHWKAKDLKKKLSRLSEEEAISAVSNQLVATSKVAWFKHSLLQVAIILYGIGAGLLGISVLWP